MGRSEKISKKRTDGNNMGVEFEPRSSHVAVRLDNQIIVFSGANYITGNLYCHRQIFIYNLNKKQWKKFTVPKRQSCPDDREQASAQCLLEKILYICMVVSGANICNLTTLL